MLLPKGVLPSPLQASQHIEEGEKPGEQGQASGWSIPSSNDVQPDLP